MKVLLDTSALMMPVNFNVDVITEIRDNFPEAEFYTLKSVVRELEHIQGKGHKEKVAANVALKLTEKIKILDEKGDVDSKLIELSDEYAICTTDKEVLQILRKEGKSIFYLKNKNYITWENVD